jgi:GT2 family glycosyltransferase
VAFADDDSWWAADALRRAVELLARTPQLAGVAARVLVGPERRLDPVCEAMARSPLGRPPGLPGPVVLGFVACGVVMRREPFLAAGGFERRFGVGGEEELLALDLAAAGWSIAYVPEVVAHHHPASARNPATRRRVQVRNTLWTAWLRRPGRSLARVTVGALPAAARDAAAARGMAEAARGLPWVLRRRRVVPTAVERAARAVERAP